jgi:hypothetical protein
MPGNERKRAEWYSAAIDVVFIPDSISRNGHNAPRGRGKPTLDVGAIDKEKAAYQAEQWTKEEAE